MSILNSINTIQEIFLRKKHKDLENELERITNMPTKITTDLKIKYLQELELECGIKNGQLFEGVDVAEIRARIVLDILKEDQREMVAKQANP